MVISLGQSDYTVTTATLIAVRSGGGECQRLSSKIFQLQKNNCRSSLILSRVVMVDRRKEELCFAKMTEKTESSLMFTMWNFTNFSKKHMLQSLPCSNSQDWLSELLNNFTAFKKLPVFCIVSHDRWSRQWRNLRLDSLVFLSMHALACLGLWSRRLAFTIRTLHIRTAMIQYSRWKQHW